MTSYKSSLQAIKMIGQKTIKTAFVGIAKSFEDFIGTQPKVQQALYISWDSRDFIGYLENHQSNGYRDVFTVYFVTPPQLHVKGDNKDVLEQLDDLLNTYITYYEYKEGSQPRKISVTGCQGIASGLYDVIQIGLEVI